MSDAPYTQVNEAWPKYEPDWWVLDVPTGRTGLVRRRFRSPFSKDANYEIQFGADGPFELRIHRQLLLATKDQVAVMEGTGPRP